jgi:hypothetical protein
MVFELFAATFALAGAGFTVHVSKRDLLSVDVQAAYYRHRDLLELLKRLV